MGEILILLALSGGGLAWYTKRKNGPVRPTGLPVPVPAQIGSGGKSGGPSGVMTPAPQGGATSLAPQDLIPVATTWNTSGGPDGVMTTDKIIEPVSSQDFPGKYSPRFASPGIDDTTLIGVFASSAGFPPDKAVSSNAAPQDWGSANPTATTASGGGIGSIFPKSKPASAMRTRRRGFTIWGGFWPHQKSSEVGVKPGGIADMNPGVSMTTAGGRTQASSLVRVNTIGRPGRGMKLPQLPSQVTRGGLVPVPAGGFSPGPPVPMIPRIPGFDSIFRVLGAQPGDVVTSQPPQLGVPMNPKAGTNL